MMSTNMTDFLKKINLGKLNKLTDDVVQNVVCGPDCQRANEVEALKLKYLNAKTNVETAPEQLATAERNYFMLANGEEYMDQELGKRAKVITDAYKKKMAEAIQGIQLKIAAYEGLYNNVANINELHATYQLDNADLEAQVSDSKEDALTNGRKAYYEEQGIGTLDSVYTIEKYIYWVVAVIVLVVLFINGEMSIQYKIMAAIIICVYPFISENLLSYLIDLCHRIYYWLPKNALVSS